MLLIHTARASVASETASRGQVLARRTQTSARAVLLDVARVHRRQTEFALSRLISGTGRSLHLLDLTGPRSLAGV
jgi:hypothetical protein